MCRAAQEQGVRSCLALPLSSPIGLMGCYNFYSVRPGEFGEEDRGQLEVFAGNAAGAVALAVKLADQAKLSEDLQQALTSRAVIDRAIGITMAQQCCDAATAFNILRRASQNRNIKLRELVAEIVTMVGGKPPEPGTFQPRRSWQISLAVRQAMPGQVEHCATASATVAARGTCWSTPVTSSARSTTRLCATNRSSIPSARA
jgi:hypothetical protein